MTDNEIIKALECCSKPYCNDNKCPLHKNTVNTKDCITQLSTNALDLINRQKAEIEKQEAEIERLNKILDYYALEYGSVLDKSKVISKAKAEAVKEYAKMLKKKETTAISCKRFEGVISTDDIDNLLKEFTEEQGGVTAESAISALQEATKKFKDAPLDAYLGLQIGRTMDMGDNQE